MLTRFFKWLWVDVLGLHWHDYGNWIEGQILRSEDDVQIGSAVRRVCKTCGYIQIVRTY